MLNRHRWTLVVSLLLAGSVPIGAAFAQTALGTPTITLDANYIYWTPVPGAEAYDLIRADLGALRQSGGDYTTAVRACLQDGYPASLELKQRYQGVPKPGEAFLFLMRATTQSDPGTFDSGGAGQQGSRDAEIKAALVSCYESTTPQSRISIKGDNQFTSSRGVVAGTGTPGDPYVISGWDIRCGNPAGSPGIEIQDTTAPFVIRDVLVHECQDAIVLERTSQGSIERSHLEGDQRGVVLIDSDGTRLDGNMFLSVLDTAIAVSGGNGHLIRRNYISNVPVGIDLEAVQGATIYRNNMLYNTTQAVVHGGCCIEWSRPLPDGGNFWSDYDGPDLCAGANQDLCDATSYDNDGIGDWAWAVPDYGADRYPFMTLVSDDGDTGPPSATITAPAQGAVTSQAPLVVSGQADDAGVGVDHVEVRQNSGAWTTATGVKPWQTNYALAPGENLIEAAAVDREGNRSPTAWTTITYNVPVTWALSITTSQASYPPGVAVPITVRVTNTSPVTGSLTFPDTCEATFTVANAGGTVLYDQLAHDGCFEVIYSRSVAAGGSLTYSFSWAQVNDQGAPVPAGANYTLRGYSRAYETVPPRSTAVSITP